MDCTVQVKGKDIQPLLQGVATLEEGWQLLYLGDLCLWDSHFEQVRSFSLLFICLILLLLKLARLSVGDRVQRWAVM